VVILGEHSAQKPILSLAYVPSEAGPVSKKAPVKVYFIASATADIAPKFFDSHDARWKVRHSDGDYHPTNELFNKLQDIRIENKTLLEFTLYEKLSMWQFLPSHLWPSFFRVVQLIDVITQIVDDIVPRQICVFPADDIYWYGTTKAIGEANNIPIIIEAAEADRTYLNTVGNREKIRDVLARTGVLRFLRSGRWLFAHNRKKKGTSETNEEKRGKKSLFTSFARHWVPLPGDASRKYDEQFYPLLPALRKTGWLDFVGIDLPYASDAAKLDERRRHVESGIRWREFYSYEPQPGKSPTKAKNFFEKNWYVLKKDLVFLKNFKYKGVCLMAALERDLKQAFLNQLPGCTQMLATAERILDEEQPNAVLVSYEAGPYQRALTIQAQRKGILTVGLQHGMIFDNHYDYMHTRITNDVVADPYGFTVPKVTCVWGSMWKEVLTETGHYPKDTVVITGNWRYDHIIKIMGFMDVQIIKQEFKIAPGKSVVLILSSRSDCTRYIRECLMVLAKRPECQALIKLHPSQDAKPVRELLPQFGYSDDALVEGKLIEAIKIADLVISQTSTSALEAVLLERPLVLVNLNADISWMPPYINDGICLYVTKAAELAEAVEKGLKDEATRERLRKARKEFVYRYFFDLDGRASERVAQEIEKRLKER